MPLAEIRRFALLRIKGDKTIPERIELLQAHETRILDQMAELESHRLKVREKMALCRQGNLAD